MIRSNLLRVAVFFGLVLVQTPYGASAEEDAATELFVVHFSTGTKWDPDKLPQDQDAFSDHAANMRALREQGRIRFGARYEGFGMIIIDGVSLDEASALISADPGVRSGIFTFTIAPINVFYGWRGSGE